MNIKGASRLALITLVVLGITAAGVISIYTGIFPIAGVTQTATMGSTITRSTTIPVQAPASTTSTASTSSVTTSSSTITTTATTSSTTASTTTTSTKQAAPPQSQAGLQVRAWLGASAYLDQYKCPEGRRTTGVAYYANITFGSKPVSNANVSVMTWNINGSYLGMGSNPMSYNSTSGLWRGGAIYGCAPVGTYYGKVSVSAVYNDKQVTAEATTDEFDVIGIKSSTTASTTTTSTKLDTKSPNALFEEEFGGESLGGHWTIVNDTTPSAIRVSNGVVEMGVPTPYSGAFFPSIRAQFKNSSVSRYEIDLKYSYRNPLNKTYLLILSDEINPAISSTSVMLGSDNDKGKTGVGIFYQKEVETRPGVVANQTVGNGIALPDKDLSEHVIRLTFDNRSVSVYLDGELKGTKEFFGSARLQYIWLGSLSTIVYPYPTQWGGFSVDYIKAATANP